MAAFRLVSVIAAAGMLGMGALSGCTSYTNVNGPESGPAVQDPNGLQAERVTRTALAWVARRHVEGPFVLNLPAGTSLETANDIAAEVGMGATVPMSPDVDLPVLHVTRVWIRVSDAKVDVLYPMVDGTGEEQFRAVTVWLNAGVRPWTVSRGQYWTPGIVPVPPIYVPIPQEELLAIREAEREAARAARRADQAEPEGDDPAADAPAEPEPASDPAPDQQDQSAVYREVPVGEPSSGGGA